MKLKKVCMLTLAALSLFAFTSCNEKNNGTTTKPTEVITTTVTQSSDPVVNNDDAQVDNKYKIYLLAQNSGFSGTYEEWLASIKGDSISLEVIDGKLKWKYGTEADSAYRELLDLSSLKGTDGKTPVITIGDNGNWFIDGEDSLVKARATDGKGISSIALKNKVGKVDTYIITFTDGTTTEFTVTNGQDGEGKAIESISKTGTNGLVDTYTITFTDADTYSFNVTNGAAGSAGAAGRGIKSIDKVTNDLVDTYTITFTDDTTFEFTVTNGKDGKDAPQPDPNVFESYEWIDGDLFKVTVTINGTESETVYSVFKGEWINSFKRITGYDSNHQLILEEKDRWDEENNKWVGEEQKYELVINEGTKTETKYIWSNESDSWINSWKHTESYDSNDRLILTETYNWDGENSAWVGEGIKHELEYDDDENVRVSIAYAWSNESGSWEKNGKEVTHYDTNGNCKLVEAVPWDATTNSWSTTIKYIANYENGVVVNWANYKWSSVKNDWSEYANAYYYNPKDGTITNAFYTWTDDVSGWTKATMNGQIIRGGTKYYEVELRIEWDSVNNKYVTKQVTEKSNFWKDGEKEFYSENTYYESNLPWSDNRYLWFRKITTAYNVMDSVNEIYHEEYFDYYFSLESKMFVPERFVDKQYTYNYLYDGVNGNHAIRDERIINETIAEGEYDIATDMFSVGYTTTTTVDSNNRVTRLEKREYKDGNEGVLIKVEEYTYNENGRLTKIEGFESPDDNGQWTDIWVYTYTYDEHNRYDSMLVVQKESMDAEFDNIWRSETVYHEDGSYTSTSYNWDKTANDWVYDNTWSL